jgi:ADP-heptose:LPS heptosyltransferase
LKLDDYLFINLQYGDVQSEIDQSEKKYGIKILTLADNFSNIDNLSTLISFCDKIITIDNTTVHLAGALGVETILLLPYSSDWRWLINSEKSYWYESVRILSQSKFNDWSAAFKNLDEKVTF